jgi:hypothetical protein
MGGSSATGCAGGERLDLNPIEDRAELEDPLPRLRVV